VPQRVGIDLVSIEAVEQSIARFADRYLERVYTEQELADCAGADGPDASRLAARFAAKEAAIKVLRPANGQAVPWRDIEITRAEGGWAEIGLRGPAAELAQVAVLDEWAVSLTHENGYAAAVVFATAR
jgi:holo-[acyl-carrier protein] synthase